MIHLDRNHHPSPLSKQNLIGQTADHHNILAWSPVPHEDDYKLAVQPDLIPSPPLPLPSRPGPVTPADTQDPLESHTDSPASPADGNSTSPTRDRSSSLSPAPETGSPLASPRDDKEAPKPPPRREEEEEEDEQPQVSRLSTPLSELSPPPDQEDEPDQPTGPSDKPEVDVAAGKDKEEPKPATTSPPSSNHEAGPDKSSSNFMPSQSPPARVTPSIDSPATPSTSTALPASPTQSSDPKVVSILELNMELLKVCMEFQNRGFAVSEIRFQQYSSRLQSNLTWLAAAADHGRQGAHSNMLLPTMDPPPHVEFSPMERIQQIYTELPSIFAKEIARRHQFGVIPTPAPNMVTGTPNLKRDRPDEASAEIAMKRRNTGDSKNMMPPPPSIPPVTHATSTQFSLPMTNGSIPGVPQPQLASPRLSEAQIASINPSVMNTAEAQLAASSRERIRQAQIRAAQQQQAQAIRQMSPPSGNPSSQQQQQQQQQMPGGPMMNNNANATAGPSNLAGVPNGMPTNEATQQTYRMLQTPNHPLVQYMQRMIPGFSGLPVHAQVQKMMMAQSAMQARQEHQNQQQQQQQQQNQQNQMGSQGQQQRPPNMQQQMPGIPMQGMNAGGQFPGPSASPVSPVPPQSPMVPQAQQNPMFPPQPSQNSGGGIDPRTMAQSGLPPGVNINNLTPHQRQQLVLMQQSRYGGNNANPNSSGMMMNPQQVAYAQQQQERMREQQRAAMQAGGGIPQAPSPMSGNDAFPAMRSNSTIPGIARSTRSPSDGPPTRAPSLGQEDYRRMMEQQQQQQQYQQQQQQQASRAMSARSPVHNQQQGMAGSAQWQQNQNQQMQQQQQMQMNHLQGQGQGQGSPSYSMSPPGSASGHGPSYGGGGGGSGGGSVGAPSPSNSQNWSQQGQGNYPFAPSPGAGVAHQSDHMQQLRHMSATPGPQQQMQQSQNTSPPAEQSIPNDFDIFPWA